MGAAPTFTVATKAFEVMRHHGLTTMFANPGSTEVPFLSLLPDDFTFVLGLHEGSVIGMATGFAIAENRPALALLHTTAGLGNAVGAIATARVNRAPLVIIVGQQDRRHLAFEPFLTGKLDGLAGDYPLEVLSPSRGVDVPAAISRAALTAEQGAGPVLVIVPMNDWLDPADPDADAYARRVIVAPTGLPPELSKIAGILASASSPVLVAAAGADSTEGWDASVRLAERLGASVWIEPFGARAAFPQTHPLYRGQLPADRTRLREVLEPHDVMLVVGGAALRQYPYQTGPLIPPHTRMFVLSADATEANRSPAEIALVGDPAALCVGLLDAMPTDVRPPAEDSTNTVPASRTSQSHPAGTDGPLIPADVFHLMAELLDEDTVVVEESPSSRPALQALVPARRPLGFLSAAMGGLGFAMPAAIGVKMAQPHRPVIAVIGDGSSLYSIQSLWTAGTTGTGVVFIILANGGYAVMDLLAGQRNAKPAWPGFPEVSVSTLAQGFGIEAIRITDRAELKSTLTRVLPTLAHRRTPLLIEITVAADSTFAP